MGGVTTSVSQKQEKALPEREFEQLRFLGPKAARWSWLALPVSVSGILTADQQRIPKPKNQSLLSTLSLKNDRQRGPLSNKAV